MYHSAPIRKWPTYFKQLKCTTSTLSKFCFVCVFLFWAPFYSTDFPCKLASSPQPIGTRVPGFSPARPLHTGCGNLFQALPPANSAQFGRRKSERKSPCLHPLCLWPLHPQQVIQQASDEGKTNSQKHPTNKKNIHRSRINRFSETF